MDKMTQYIMIESIITTLNSQTGTIRDLSNEMDSEALEYTAGLIDTALYLLNIKLITIKEELKKEGYFCK